MAFHLESLAKLEHYDPHAYLGLHVDEDHQKRVRLFRPGAKQVFVEVLGEIVEASFCSEGIFEVVVPSHLTALDYRVYHQNGLLSYDPYAFWPSIGELDLYLFNKGVHYELYNILGARLFKHEGVEGVRFAVWAPSAKSVSLVADFNHWDGRVNPMRSLGQSGIFELFVPGLGIGEKYKFEIKTQEKKVLLKSDPFALSSEMRPKTASIVASIDSFSWEDEQWLKQRQEKKDQPKPINIYEVHLGSWKKEKGAFLNYRQLAKKLASYCKELGFTHVELLPIQEHPLDESWGYQVSGFYAVTSRFGTPTDFQWFVNHLHKEGIGVILDWVPGHFPSDAFSLGHFDGTSLYEHADPRQGWHPHWKTHIFNFGRLEVANFLIANALFWLEVMHVDGLRVDAVASMLYLDYGRGPGQWIPNAYGGKDNLEAIEFLKHLNAIVHKKHPGSMMIAEESTSFARVSHAVEQGGLGFSMKWNMGWMNDTLRYFSKDMIFRNHHHNDLTFGLLYAFTERFVLPLSHDEVVHGKKSLISKMPGDLWQKFANIRLLLSYLMCQPGKKLLFMGGEIAQWDEWNSVGEISWDLLRYPTHQGVQTMVKELNHLYLERSELWERDFDFTGFDWVDFSDYTNSVISYLRKSSNGMLLCVHNFTPMFHPEYTIWTKKIEKAKEIFNSDALRFGGSGKENLSLNILRGEDVSPYGLTIQLAPLATLIFEVNNT